MRQTFRFLSVLALLLVSAACGWWASQPSRVASGEVKDYTALDHRQTRTEASKPSLDPSTPELSLVNMGPALARFLDPRASDRIPPNITEQIPGLRYPDEVLAVRVLLDNRLEGDSIRNECIDLLRRSEFPDLGDLLWSFLNRSDERERFRAFLAQHLGIELISAIGQSRSVLRARMMVLLDDRHLAVRREALGALVAIRDSEAVDIVRDGLKGPRWQDARDLIVHSAFALGLSNMRDAIRPLMHDQDTEVRIASVHALGAWDDEPSRGTITECASSEIPRLRRAAEHALRFLNEQNPSIGTAGQP